jgi:hypothetical protein
VSKNLILKCLYITNISTERIGAPARLPAFQYKVYVEKLLLFHFPTPCPVSSALLAERRMNTAFRTGPFLFLLHNVMSLIPPPLPLRSLITPSLSSLCCSEFKCALEIFMCHLQKKQKYPSPNETGRHRFESTQLVVSGPQLLVLIRKVTDSNMYKSGN